MLGVMRHHLAIALATLMPSIALADPEIMIHEQDLAERGEVAVTMHANHTFRGDRSAVDGAWPSHRNTFVMAEFATGLAPGWEVGVHIPFQRAAIDSSVGNAGAWGSSGVMFRLKHITQQESGFFYGFNAEYDMLAKRFTPQTRGAEMRGIVGFDAEQYRVTLNPHLMLGWGNGQERTLNFNIDMKALHKLRPDFAWGAELYTDWGETNHLRPGEGDRTVYLVGEFDTRIGDLHLGIGRGFKETPERLNFKVVWSDKF